MSKERGKRDQEIEQAKKYVIWRLTCVMRVSSQVRKAVAEVRATSASTRCRRVAARVLAAHVAQSRAALIATRLHKQHRHFSVSQVSSLFRTHWSNG